MPRIARVEYAGAIYHVMDRGNRLEKIYEDASDREMFLKTLLGEAVGTRFIPLILVWPIVHCELARSLLRGKFS